MFVYTQVLHAGDKLLLVLMTVYTPADGLGGGGVLPEAPLVPPCPLPFVCLWGLGGQGLD